MAPFVHCGERLPARTLPMLICSRLCDQPVHSQAHRRDLRLDRSIGALGRLKVRGLEEARAAVTFALGAYDLIRVTQAPGDPAMSVQGKWRIVERPDYEADFPEMMGRLTSSSASRAVSSPSDASLVRSTAQSMVTRWRSPGAERRDEGSLCRWMGRASRGWDS
jgi:hypothetical protein